MSEGWIKLHRKVVHSPMWRNPNLWRLFEWCLLEAAHKPVTVYVGYIEVDLQPGQLLFGRRMAHRETGLTEQTVRTCMHVLTSGENPPLTMKSTKAYSIVTIVNWDIYQNDNAASNPQVTHRPTNEQPTSNPRVTTNKNDQEISPSPAHARIGEQGKGGDAEYRPPPYEPPDIPEDVYAYAVNVLGWLTPDVPLKSLS